MQPKQTYFSTKAIYACCQAHQLLLFMDGARLGSALNAQDNDIQWEDLAQYTDVFYIGATKNGGLLGEAIVINKPSLQEGFEYHLKQNISAMGDMFAGYLNQKLDLYLSILDE